MRPLAFAVLLGFLFGPRSAESHALSPALLELRELEDGLVSVLWKVSLAVDGAAERGFWPEVVDCSEVGERRQAKTRNASLTRWFVRCSEPGLSGRRVTIVGLEAKKADVLLSVSFSDARSHTGVLRPASPTVVLPAQPRLIREGFAYLILGLEHILSGFDHLLFVLGLLLLVGPGSMLVKTITAFTVGHSITLSLASLDVVRVPSAPTEAVIALSILLLAVELSHPKDDSLTRRIPWVVAICFGLLHGFGFAGALQETGLPQGAIPVALASFNIGVEIGQLLFVASVILAGWAAGRVAPAHAETLARLKQGLYFAVGSLAAFWFVERTSVLF